MKAAASYGKLRVNARRYPALAAFLFCAACAAPPPPSTPPVKAAHPATAPKPPVVATQPVTAPSANKGVVKVALLLPLSGANAALGQAMMDAANLAVYDQANKGFELLPEDTGDTPEKARVAADHAIKAGAQLIIGPLLSSSVATVAPIAAAAHVNVISFTTDASQGRDNVFVMGFLPTTEVKRVVEYAQHVGVHGFAALAPDSPYGTLTVGALQATVPGSIAASIPAGQADIGIQAAQVKAAFPGAVLLPEGGDRLKADAHALLAAGIDLHQVHLLGTGLWDDPTLGRDQALIGGWYAGTAPAARGDFEKRFTATYKYKPQRLATLGYDATALAIVLSKQAAPAPDMFSIAAITKPSGYAGIDGVFRFLPNGQIERQLSVLQVGADGPVVIDPAPKSFPGPHPAM